MNIAKLKEAEQRFLDMYPDGFNHPQIQAIARKHKLPQRNEFCQINFAADRFDSPSEITENMIKIVTRSSMVSVFEKPKFRDYLRTFDPYQQKEISSALYEFLHGNEKKGFESMTFILEKAKLAKWTLVTIIPTYFNPSYHVFIKPTTTKNILKFMEIEDIKYKPAPSYDFYVRYREYIMQMKSHVSKSLSESNPAFTGFLMMSI